MCGNSCEGGTCILPDRMSSLSRRDWCRHPHEMVMSFIALAVAPQIYSKAWKRHLLSISTWVCFKNRRLMSM